MNYTIDATGKKIGRIATEAATFLMGKNTPEFRRNIAPKVIVEIVNSSKASVDPKKMTSSTFKRYSGYPGGLKELTMEEVIEKKGYSEVVRIAVKGMLPKNKLQDVMMKNLKISE